MNQIAILKFLPVMAGREEEIAKLWPDGKVACGWQVADMRRCGEDKLTNGSEDPKRQP